MCNCTKPCRVCKCKPRTNKFGLGIRFYAKDKITPALGKIGRGTVGERLAKEVFGGGPRTLGETIFVLFMIFSLALLIHLAYWIGG